jgi:hypothetical protein
MVIHILTSLVSLALGAKLLIPRDEPRLALVVERQPMAATSADGTARARPT